MDNDLPEALSEYLLRGVSLSDLSGRIAAFDWDDQSTEAVVLRPAAGMLESLAEEVGEGLRDESELKLRAREIVNSAGWATTSPGQRRV